MCVVEWKTIRDTCNSLPKAIIKQGDVTADGCYPVINSGVSLYGYYDKYNNEGNAFTFASRGEYAGFLTYINRQFWAGGLCYPYRSKNESCFLTKYIYEYLKSKEKYIMDTLVMRGGIPALNKVDVEKIQVPIPPLAKQQEIVSHLDTFTTLISNLESELDMRRKQYEHYRNQLLDHEGKERVEMKILKEACMVNRGVRVVKKELQEEGVIPVFQNSITPMGYYHKSNYRANVPYIICAGSSSGDIGFCTVPFWAADDCVCVDSEGDFDNKFIYYFLLVKRSFLKTRVRNGAMPRLSRDVIEQLSIPILSLHEQKRIVEKLDSFEQLIQSLETEIKLRKQQYEYYREKLLTFEK